MVEGRCLDSTGRSERNGVGQVQSQASGPRVVSAQDTRVSRHGRQSARTHDGQGGPAVNRRQIDRFFETLAAELEAPARVYLTGAAAGALMGRVRPSDDIDFGLRLTGRGAGSWDTVE